MNVGRTNERLYRLTRPFRRRRFCVPTSRGAGINRSAGI